MTHITGKLILMIEDEKDILEGFKEFLEMEGFRVLCAINGEKALELLRASTELPAVIVLDLMMPVMDGFQFRERQLNNPKYAAIPVVVMSAAGYVSENGRRVKPQAYLKKPVDLDDFLNTVTKLIA